MLRQTLNSARLRGEVVQNVANGITLKQTEDERNGGHIEAGVDYPSMDEVRAMLAEAALGFERTFVLVAAFTGMRASELRGLRWQDVDFEAGVVRVRQRADGFNTIGPPKSRSGKRDIPVGRMVLNTLREWKLACPASEHNLVFPNQAGRPRELSRILATHLKPLQERAGVVDDHGAAKYSTHALRHFYAALCITPVAEGGYGYSPKRAQTVLGHASIQMTYDKYGYLLDRQVDSAVLENVERSLLG